MKVKLLCHTENCEKIVAFAAKLCYSGATIDELIEKETEQNNASFVEMLAKLGHESPLEHVSFTFGVEQVSRALLAQITRHRLASFSVQSQRYVSEENFSFVVPPEIEQNEEMFRLFSNFMNESKVAYSKLLEGLNKINLDKLEGSGLANDVAKMKAQKRSCEDARFVLPNACCCKFIVTMNARSLLNFFKLRCCNRAQWEIRQLAFKMFSLVVDVAPSLFKNAGPNCVRHGCTEGKMTCGLAAEVRNKFKLVFEKHNSNKTEQFGD